jgi:Ca-activated chloride channel family protein
MFPRHPTLAALVCLTLLSGAFLAGCSSRDETPKHTPEQEQQSALPESASTQDRSAGNEARIDSAASNPTTTPAESRPRVEPAVPIPPPGPTPGRQERDAQVLYDRSVAAASHEEAHYGLAKPASDPTGLIAVRPPAEPLDREAYTHIDTNPVHLVRETPVSTFSIDVDTASYANIRRLLNQGVLPRHDAIRVEEMINYFSYSYPVPSENEQPFSVYTEIGPSPWHAKRHLLHVGIKGYEIPEQELPPANLVFLIDVSGSMRSTDKLGLLKTAMKLLTKRLSAEDRVAIAVYAGAAGTVLEPTSGSDRFQIDGAIDRLTAGGSTNGGAGIRLAYTLARQGFIDNGINRVILATDGDFNVGTTDTEALKDLVEAERDSGVALTVLGFGGGNYNDALMQELAQIGNGNAAYIDTLNEARKVLVEEIGATLNLIAQDVKVQIEFNPDTVEEYRLIGYETRHLNREDFNNDAIDAGDIGAGHTVTALYEVALAGSGGGLIDPLRYAPEQPGESRTSELAFLKLCYKLPGTAESRLITRPLTTDQVIGELGDTSDNYRFSAAVAGFGQLLRGGEYTGAFDLGAAGRLAASARGQDVYGYRGEFLGLVRTADALSGG